MRVTDYGRGKAAELRRAVHELLLQHEAAGELPTSNRFLFNELRQAGGPEGRHYWCPRLLARGLEDRRHGLLVSLPRGAGSAWRACA
jgi:hypothetical protein